MISISPLHTIANAIFEDLDNSSKRSFYYSPYGCQDSTKCGRKTVTSPYQRRYRTWRRTLRADVEETTDGYKVVIEVPGVEKSAIDISTKSDEENAVVVTVSQSNKKVSEEEKTDMTEEKTVEDEIEMETEKDSEKEGYVNVSDISDEKVNDSEKDQTESSKDMKADEEQKAKSLWQERTSFPGSVSRTFILPRNCDIEKGSAKLENGLLFLTFPKKQFSTATKITIE